MSSNCRVIFYVLLSVILPVCLLPVSILILIPLYTLQFIVSILAQLFKPKLGQMLTGHSALFAVDNPYSPSGPSATSLVAILVLDGDLTRQNVQDIGFRTVGKAVDVNEKILYPEMMQYITTWLGYFFWAPEQNFRLEDHIIDVNLATMEGHDVDKETVLAYSMKLVQTPFPNKYQSPWQLHVIRQYNKNSTAVVFWWHHALADGFSAVSLLLASNDEPGQVVGVGQQILPSLSMLDRITFPFRVPYDFIKVIAECWNEPGLGPRGPGRKPATTLTKTYTAGWSSIPLARLKLIKHKYNVSLMAVNLAFFAGLITNFVGVNNKVSIPEYINCMMPLPLPKHPSKLSNWMTAGVLRLPLGIQDPIERLQKIDTNLKQLKRSTFPWTAVIGVRIGGVLPGPLLRLVARLITTGIVSCFPGPSTDPTVKCFNRPLLDLHFASGLLRGSVSVGIAALSYNGGMNFVFGFDNAIICPAEQQRERVDVDVDNNATVLLEQLVTKEILTLENSVKTFAFETSP